MSTYDHFAKDLDPTPRPRRRYSQFSADSQAKTVADAVAFCERNGLALDHVSLAHNHVRWDDVETPEEVRHRIERTERSRAEHLERIREMHAEYASRGLYADTEGSD